MSDELVPDSNHISRHCGGSHVEDGEIGADAFMLRASDESLSVNWLELLQLSDRQSEIREVCRVLRDKGRTLGPTSVIAVLNVGEVLEHVRNAEARTLKVVHVPEENDPSHSGIFGYTAEDDIIADLIAQKINETHPVE